MQNDSIRQSCSSCTQRGRINAENLHPKGFCKRRERIGYPYLTKLHAKGIRATFDARTGLIEGFTVVDGNHDVAPLHRAPWVGTDEIMPEDAPPLMATLGGDFFCSPFCATENGSPFHGWPPNSPWDIVLSEESHLRAVLRKSVSNATLVKRLALMDDHPFVYQQHTFVGGHGQVSFANHANVSVPNGALIRVSPKGDMGDSSRSTRERP